MDTRARQKQSVINEKFNTLADPRRVVSILPRFAGAKPKSVKVKIIKSYKDDKSYSLVALYTLYFGKGKTKKIVGLAHSDGRKEYAYKMDKYLSAAVKKVSKNTVVPAAYGYLKSYNVFLNEHVAGKTFAEVIKRRRGLPKIYSDRVVELLAALQKVSIPGKTKTKTNFYDIENNIRLLKSEVGKKRQVQSKESLKS